MRRGAWGLMLLLTLIVAAYALTSAFVPSARDGFVADLFAAKAIPAFAHLVGGAVAVVGGALQFSNRLRWRRPRIHRGLGIAYVAAVFIGAPSAIVMAPTSQGGLTAHFGFGILGVLWLFATAVAFLRVRARDFPGHRIWMIRSYALCLAAVTLRLYLPFALGFGVPFDEAYPTIAWLCWVPNLVLAEWLITTSTVAPLEATT